MSLIRVNEADFTSDLRLTRAISKGGLIMVHVSWCGHCKKALPELENVSNMLGKSFDIYVLDGDENPNFVKKAKIMGFPTIVYINKNGKIDERFAELRHSANILKFICKKSLVCMK